MMKENISRGFASDNNSGVHPEVLKAISEINTGHVVAYGDDYYTERAVKKFREHLGDKAEVFFVFNGTGANVLGIKAVTDSYHAVICAETAHINVDECGAPERFTGCKLLTLETQNGKISVPQIKKHMHGFGFEHHAQPRVISITQSTELGTVYTVSEIKRITDYAHKNNMIVHMDGARIANAAAFSGCSLKEMTADAGIDVLSFGGTKNGMMFGEAVVFFKKELAANFKYIRKQGMQLNSKMRFVAVQFETILTDNLFLKTAGHANKMAQLLADKIKEIPSISITREVEANGVFAIVPPEYIKALQEKFFFYVWNEETSEVRWVTSFDTTEEDVFLFVDFVTCIVQ